MNNSKTTLLLSTLGLATAVAGCLLPMPGGVNPNQDAGNQPTCTATICADPLQCSGWDAGAVNLSLTYCLPTTAQYPYANGGFGAVTVADLTFYWDQGALNDSFSFRLPGAPDAGTFSDWGKIHGAAALGTGANVCFWNSTGSTPEYLEEQAGINPTVNPDGGQTGSFSLTITSLTDAGFVGGLWNFNIHGSAHVVCPAAVPGTGATGTITVDSTF